MKLLHSLIIIALVNTWCSTNAHAEDAAALWGEWQLTDTSIEIPESCQNIFFRYTEDGSMEARDGNLVMTWAYTVTQVPNGLIVHSSYISDNAQSNCQGLSAEFVRQNNVDRILVQFVGGQDKLRIYFGVTDDLPFIVLMRKNSRAPFAPLHSERDAKQK